LSETEEVPVGKPKRKIWKLVVPVIVVAILIPSLMYAYAYVALGDAYSKSWDTIDTSELSAPDLSTMLEGTEWTEELTLHNPTGTSIRLIEVNFDSWVDGKKFETIRETDVYLPAGGSTTLTYTRYFDSEIIGIKTSDSYVSKVRKEIVASTNIFFLTVTRTFIYENVETTYNIW